MGQAVRAALDVRKVRAVHRNTHTDFAPVRVAFLVVIFLHRKVRDKLKIKQLVKTQVLQPQKVGIPDYGGRQEEHLKVLVVEQQSLPFEAVPHVARVPAKGPLEIVEQHRRMA